MYTFTGSGLTEQVLLTTYEVVTGTTTAYPTASVVGHEKVIIVLNYKIRIYSFFGGEAEFLLQRKIGAGDWEYVDFQGACFTIPALQDGYIEWKFHDPHYTGIPAGQSIQHRLLARKTVEGDAISLHYSLAEPGETDTTVIVKFKYNFDGEEIEEMFMFFRAQADIRAAIKTDGTLWTWGNNSWGRLGVGDGDHRDIPTLVGSGYAYVDVYKAYLFTVAIKTDGTLWAWGYGGQGQLGQGSTSNQFSPVQVGTGTDWKRASIGNNHMAAIKNDGTIWACGRNYEGQLGQGTFSAGSQVLVQIGTATDWVDIECSQNFTYAQNSSNEFWATGENGLGELGTDDGIDKNVLTLVSF